MKADEISAVICILEEFIVLGSAIPASFKIRNVLLEKKGSVPAPWRALQEHPPCSELSSSGLLAKNCSVAKVSAGVLVFSRSVLEMSEMCWIL